jgi:sulfofructose kinase
MPDNLSKIQVIGLGQACVDYLGRIPAYPQEDKKVELLDLSIQTGGPASTALVFLSRLGIHTSFIGSISDDFFGKEIIKGLQKAGVDITCLKITPGYTSQFAFIAISESSGNRNIFWTRGDVPFLTPDDVVLDPFQNVRILHLDSLMINASLEAAKQAQNRNIKVVMDAGTMREGSLDLIAMVDVLIASEDFAIPLVGDTATPEDRLNVLKQYCSGDIVITLGIKGSIGSNKQHDIVHQRAFYVKAADTTGAGDVYHGAYIYGLLNEWDMPQCMRFASAAAALSCTEIGAGKKISTLHEIQSLIDSPTET